MGSNLLLGFKGGLPSKSLSCQIRWGTGIALFSGVPQPRDYLDAFILIASHSHCVVCHCNCIFPCVELNVLRQLIILICSQVALQCLAASFSAGLGTAGAKSSIKAGQSCWEQPHAGFFVEFTKPGPGCQLLLHLNLQLYLVLF